MLRQPYNNQTIVTIGINAKSKYFDLRNWKGTQTITILSRIKTFRLCNNFHCKYGMVDCTYTCSSTGTKTHRIWWKLPVSLPRHLLFTVGQSIVVLWRHANIYYDVIQPIVLRQLCNPFVKVNVRGNMRKFINDTYSLWTMYSFLFMVSPPQHFFLRRLPRIFPVTAPKPRKFPMVISAHYRFYVSASVNVCIEFVDAVSDFL